MTPEKGGGMIIPKPELFLKQELMGDLTSISEAELEKVLPAILWVDEVNRRLLILGAQDVPSGLFLSSEHWPVGRKIYEAAAKCQSEAIDILESKRRSDK